MNRQKTLLVQDYLRSGKTLDELKAEHGVKNYICNGKISLTYDQIEAKESDPLAQQCRGLVLREITHDIVAYPFDRFFNLDQTVLIPKDFDWSTAEYITKLDGTLVIVYFDTVQNKWCCGTRSRPEADGNVDGGEQTFADLVKIAIKRMWEQNNLSVSFCNVPFDGAFGLQDGFELQNFMERFWSVNRYRDFTFCFELTSPFNRIVCKYDDIKLTLLAVRNNLTLKEEDPHEWVKNHFGFGLETPKLYSFNSIKDMIDVISTWNPEEHEGIVVKDANFNRIKVKNPAYIALNRSKDILSSSMRGCLELVLLGKDDDVKSILSPIIIERIENIKRAFTQLVHETRCDYDELKNIADIKQYALLAQKRRWPAVLFALKRNKIKNIEDFYLKNNISASVLDNILKICGF